MSKILQRQLRGEQIFHCKSGSRLIVRTYQRAFKIFVLDLKRWLLAVSITREKGLVLLSKSTSLSASIHSRKKEKKINDLNAYSS